MKALIISNYDDGTTLVADTVYIKDESPIDTGLIDSNGVSIFKIKRNNPIGFDLGITDEC